MNAADGAAKLIQGKLGNVNGLAIAARALIVYHLAEQRPMMGAFLDALGISAFKLASLSVVDYRALEGFVERREQWKAVVEAKEAVERAVPFAFLVQSLMISWYAVSCEPAAGMEHRRQRCPWYRSKATPSAADMRDALRGEFAAARFSAIGPGQNKPPKNDPSVPACDPTAA